VLQRHRQDGWSTAFEGLGMLAAWMSVVVGSSNGIVRDSPRWQQKCFGNVSETTGLALYHCTYSGIQDAAGRFGTLLQQLERWNRENRRTTHHKRSKRAHPSVRHPGDAKNESSGTWHPNRGRERDSEEIGCVTRLCEDNRHFGLRLPTNPQQSNPSEAERSLYRKPISLDSGIPVSRDWGVMSRSRGVVRTPAFAPSRSKASQGLETIRTVYQYQEKSVSTVCRGERTHWRDALRESW